MYKWSNAYYVWGQLSWNFLICINFHTTLWSGYCYHPILQMEKLRHREIKLPAYDHIVTKVEGSRLEPRKLGCRIYASNRDTDSPPRRKVRWMKTKNDPQFLLPEITTLKYFIIPSPWKQCNSIKVLTFIYPASKFLDISYIMFFINMIFINYISVRHIGDIIYVITPLLLNLEVISNFLLS